MSDRSLVTDAFTEDGRTSLRLLFIDGFLNVGNKVGDWKELRGALAECNADDLVCLEGDGGEISELFTY